MLKTFDFPPNVLLNSWSHRLGIRYSSRDAYVTINERDKKVASCKLYYVFHDNQLLKRNDKKRSFSHLVTDATQFMMDYRQPLICLNLKIRMFSDFNLDVKLKRFFNVRPATIIFFIITKTKYYNFTETFGK